MITEILFGALLTMGFPNHTELPLKQAAPYTFMWEEQRKRNRKERRAGIPQQSVHWIGTTSFMFGGYC
ncbi:MAG: hypothetical protein SOW56_06115 [Bacteroidaceae bacterium]|nr:hypothetical protein [Bacteroidaceae bacterium]